MSRLSLIAAALVAALLLAGCQAAMDDNEEQANAVADAAVLVAPISDSDEEWKAYLGRVIAQNMDGITERTFNYYLPAGTDPAEAEGPYSRMLMDVQLAVQRGVLPGNMLSFSSPNSTLMADLVVAAFTAEGIKDTALSGTRVLFIGEASDELRVRQVVLATGAEFRFVEAR